MRTKPLFLGALAALSLLAVGQIPPSGADKRVDLKVENVDVRESLRTIFKQVGISYTIAPEVRGAVRADFHGLSLNEALGVVLRQVGAHTRVEYGIYQIVPDAVIEARPDPSYNVLSTATQASSSPEPTAVASDAKALYVVRFGVVHKIDKATMRETGKIDLNAPKIRIEY